ncbi:MAG: ATP synthase F1 subunit gamma [Treponema sp.]|jgi:F-type H+-transporting ATPase subunit gamma|nr:ATP synthase F1 subunit gamma [Treponema sp.]
MTNLREVRLRMRAIRQTLQVTKAMNLIATSKLRKGRRTLEDTKPYFTRIQKSMYDIVSCADISHNKFFGRKNTQNVSPRSAVVVISSDKGLAGGFNANVFRPVNTLCGNVQRPVLITIGNIAQRFFANSAYPILESFSFKSQLPSLDDAKMIADYIMSQFLWGAFDSVYLVYTYMYSAVRLQPDVLQMLPLSAEKIQEKIMQTGGEKRVKLQFEFIPSEDAVFEALIPIYLQGIIYGALVESYASEQNARMSAMDESSKNAEKMLDKLQIFYNRARQAAITQEMTEIIGGSNALM